jgi:hypothetical protein
VVKEVIVFDNTSDHNSDAPPQSEKFLRTEVTVAIATSGDRSTRRKRENDCNDACNGEKHFAPGNVFQALFFPVNAWKILVNHVKNVRKAIW